MKFGLFIGAFVLSVALGVGGLFAFGVPVARAQTLTPEQRATLQAEYDQLQVEIAQWQKVLDDTKAKKNTLTGDVTALNAQIAKAQKEIQQRSITITTLGSEITQKTAAISTLEQKLAAGKEALAKLMREKNEAETEPLAILALSADDLSTFFSDVQNIDTINGQLQDLFDTLRGVKTETQKEKDALDVKKNAELDARHDVVVKQTAIKQDEVQKQQLLDVTKKDEKAYQAVLSERQKRATEIRNALFELRDSAGISFQSALQYAQQAEAATGVRAAFILGILRQESNLGTNVGQCYLTDPLTGAGKGKNTGTPINKVMNPTRDVPPFLDLMERLGGDPYGQVVSCPQSVGYGGAMGPSQFIASTWKLYEPRIDSALGVSVADPWNAQTAIMATALYMKDLGANKATYSAERKAAASYYAGSNWQTRAALSYADSVLAFADTYQNNIDFLKDN
jgi:membrane-bound lytic murein transglycosylase B